MTERGGLPVADGGGGPAAGPERAPADGGRPPLGSWARLYALVILNLAVLVLLFGLFQRSFR